MRRLRWTRRVDPPRDIPRPEMEDPPIQQHLEQKASSPNVKHTRRHQNHPVDVGKLGRHGASRRAGGGVEIAG